jgi:hypothetical protein
MKINQLPTKQQIMSRLASTLMRSTIMRIHTTRWIAVAIISLFTHAAFGQNHQDLAAVIAGGNDALSDAVYGLHATAYGSSNGIEIAGDGNAQVLKFKAEDFTAIDFNDNALSMVNTVVIRFNNETLLDGTFDGSRLVGLENLSTVVLLATIDAPVSAVSSVAVHSLPDGVQSYYVISVPE